MALSKHFGTPSSVLAAHAGRMHSNAEVIREEMTRHLDAAASSTASSSSPRLRQAMEEMKHDAAEVAREIEVRATLWRLRLHRFFSWHDPLVTGCAFAALHVLIWEGWLVGTLHLLLAGVVTTGLAHTFKTTAEGELWKRLQVRLEPTLAQEAMAAFTAAVVGLGAAAAAGVGATVVAITPPVVQCLNDLMTWKNTRVSLRCVAYLWVAAQAVMFWQALQISFTRPITVLWSLAVCAVFFFGYFVANPDAGTVTTEQEVDAFKRRVHAAARAVRERLAPARKLRAEVAASMPAAANSTASGVPTVLLVALVAVVIDNQLNTLNAMLLLNLAAWATCLWDASRVVDAVDLLCGKILGATTVPEPPTSTPAAAS